MAQINCEGMPISDNTQEEFTIDANSNVYFYTSSIDETESTTFEITDGHSKKSAVYLSLEDGSQVLCKLIDDNEPVDDAGKIPEIVEDVAVEINNKKDARDELVCFTENGKRSYVCQIESCERRFTSRNSLKTHQRNHTGERPFKCDECDTAFNTDYALKVHRRRHTGDKPYQCPEEECGKSFRASGDLSKHSRVHSGIRPFPCTFEDCSMAFTSSTIRKTHMLTHTDDRPFKCSHEGCNKSFRSLTNCSNHERIHSGEKPFVCKICSRGFTEYSSLYKHGQVHSKTVSILPCPVCSKTYKKMQCLSSHMTKCHPDDDDNSKEEIYYLIESQESDTIVIVSDQPPSPLSST